MSVYFRKKDGQTDGQTDGRTDRRHIPRVEVSLNGIPISGLREEVSRLVAATRGLWRLSVRPSVCPSVLFSEVNAH